MCALLGVCVEWRDGFDGVSLLLVRVRVDVCGAFADFDESVPLLIELELCEWPSVSESAISNGLWAEVAGGLCSL